MPPRKPLTNVFVFLFQAEDIKKIADDDPDYVLVTCGLENMMLSGKPVAVVRVNAQSCCVDRSGSGTAKPDSVITTVAGCPVPPCIPGGSIGDDECAREVEQLLEFSRSLL